MPKISDVLSYLLPDGGWYVNGENYSNIEFLSCEPITEAELKIGYAKYEDMKAAADLQRNQDRQALLAKLGITADEAALLLA